jgi:hypothetical protein
MTQKNINNKGSAAKFKYKKQAISGNKSVVIYKVRFWTSLGNNKSIL